MKHILLYISGSWPIRVRLDHSWAVHGFISKHLFDSHNLVGPTNTYLWGVIPGTDALDTFPFRKSVQSVFFKLGVFWHQCRIYVILIISNATGSHLRSDWMADCNFNYNFFPKNFWVRVGENDLLNSTKNSPVATGWNGQLLANWIGEKTFQKVCLTQKGLN